VLIEHRVGALLVAHLGVDPARLVGAARLDEDLGLDSLMLTEALLVLEDELAVSIPGPVQVGLHTFADLLAAIASQVVADDGPLGHGAVPAGAVHARPIRPAQLRPGF